MSFIIAIATAYLAALASFPVLTLPRRKRIAAVAVLMIPIALSPLWIPRAAPFIRFLAMLLAIALLFKLYDLHVAIRQPVHPKFSAFAAFLPNVFTIVWRRLDSEPQPTARQNLAQLRQALWRSALAIIVAVWVLHTDRDWRGVPFMVEHSVKALALFLAVTSATAVVLALWRLAGERGRDFTKAPLLAPTPAEFWRRYNRPTQQFFYENVFKPFRGFRSPVRATLATFAVSALVHEYVFGIVLGRIQGYQTVFFLLQGLGVAATLRVRPTGLMLWPWLAATWIFNLTTSVLFFASLNGIFPFYSRGFPDWLTW